MSEINHAQEVRDVLEFYVKRGRTQLASAILFLPVSVAHKLDLLTMDLMRWAREVKADAEMIAEALGIQPDIWMHEYVGMMWADAPMLHRALMAAIEEAKHGQG